MSLLTQTTRQELVTLLASLPGIERQDQRDGLLRDLPLSVVQQIARSTATVPDLEAIVSRVDLWWPPDGPVSDYPLRRLVTAALGLAAESQSAAPLQAFLDRLPATVDASARPRCPYPGMVPFQPADARFFYGREREIAEMQQRLRVGHYLLVIGPSGSGKSSLVTAGLLPALAQEQPNPWHIVTMRPGATPQAALAQVLEGDPAHPASAVAALLGRHAPATRLLVIIDQFEELFAQTDRATQQAFLTTLLTLRAVDAATLVILMRADFYPNLIDSVLWPPGVGERLEVASLRGEALRAAITQPAAAVGVEVEPALVERLVADSADEPGSLPLLQEALVLLWTGLRGPSLRLTDYLALGSADRSGLAVALEKRADAIYNQLNAAQQGIARRVFMRLIAFGEGRLDTRRQQTVADLQVPGESPALFAATLATLTDHRLLTTSGAEQAAGPRRVDIAHEVLIRDWPLLRTWVAERQGSEQTRRRLEEKAAEWAHLGRGSGGLLDAAELPEADRWLASAEAAELGASADLHDLVSVSHEALAAAEREREATRQRELTLERERREAVEARATAQAQANRRLRRQALALAGLVLLALGAASLAVFFGLAAQAAQAQAVRDRDIGTTRRLAAQAQVALETNPQRSLLLAVESISRTRQLGIFQPDEAQDLLRPLLAPSGGTALNRPTEPVAAVGFSPDGRGLAVAGRDGSVRQWTLADLRAPASVITASQPISQAVFSPDGRWLLQVVGDSSARLWDRTRSTAGPQLLAHATALQAWPGTPAVFSKNGHWLVLADRQDTLWRWDLTNLPAGPVALSALAQDTDGVIMLAFSPDAQWLAATRAAPSAVHLWPMTPDPTSDDFGLPYRDKEAAVLPIFTPDSRQLALTDGAFMRLWDVAKARQKDYQPFVGDTGYWLNALAVSPDGRWLAAGTLSAQVFVWDLHDLNARPRVLHGPSTIVSVLGFSPPDGHWLAAGSNDQTVQVWDMTDLTTPPVVLRGHEAGVNGLAFDPAGSLLASLDRTGAARLWRLYALGADPITLRGHTSWVANVALDHSGQWLATGADDGQARLWNLSNLQAPPRVFTGVGRAPLVALSPDGSWLVTAAADDPTAQLWDLTAADPTARSLPLAGHTSRIMKAVFSSDGHYLATGSIDRTVRLWDMTRRNPAEGVIILPHDRSVWGVAFSQDGHRLVAGLDYAAWVWDLTLPNAAAQEPLKLKGHTDVVRDVAISSDGRWVLTAGWDARARLWDLQATPPREARPPLVFGDRVFAVACSADNHWCAAVAWDGEARLVDLTQPAAPPRSLPMHGGRLLAVAFSPDSRWVATAGEDSLIRVSAVTQPAQPPLILRGHTSKINDYALVFSPDSHWLVSGGQDNTARLWRVGIDDLIERACRAAGRNLTPEEWAQDLGGQAPQLTCPNLTVGDAPLVVPGPPPPPHPLPTRTAAEWAREGVRQAEQGAIRAALTAFAAAQQSDPTQLTPADWNTLCWQGSIWDYATAVQTACEQAVATANPADRPLYQDSRGLNRALRGDLVGAAADFRAGLTALQGNGQYTAIVARRQGWIAELEAGRNPITEAVLRDLQANPSEQGDLSTPAIPTPPLPVPNPASPP